MDGERCLLLSSSYYAVFSFVNGNSIIWKERESEGGRVREESEGGEGEMNKEQKLYKKRSCLYRNS